MAEPRVTVFLEQELVPRGVVLTAIAPIVVIKLRTRTLVCMDTLSA
jgi:hypothetical protein